MCGLFTCISLLFEITERRSLSIGIEDTFLSLNHKRVFPFEMQKTAAHQSFERDSLRFQGKKCFLVRGVNLTRSSVTLPGSCD